MEKTKIVVQLNNDSFDYIFNAELEDFKNDWKEQIEKHGYFSGYDYTNSFVIINPSQCGIIEFNRKYTNRI